MKKFSKYSKALSGAVYAKFITTATMELILTTRRSERGG